MVYNFNKLFTDNGFVMKVDKNGYGKTYIEDEKDRITVYDGEYYLLSNYVNSRETIYKLIEINEDSLQGYDLLIVENGSVGERSGNVIRNFIYSNLK